jgi:hypothetical protein
MSFLNISMRSAVAGIGILIFTIGMAIAELGKLLVRKALRR